MHTSAYTMSVSFTFLPTSAIRPTIIEVESSTIHVVALDDLAQKRLSI